MRAGIRDTAAQKRTGAVLQPSPKSQCAIEAKVASKILEDRAREVKDLDMHLCVF
jgi:hypothetical protein